MGGSSVDLQRFIVTSELVQVGPQFTKSLTYGVLLLWLRAGPQFMMPSTYSVLTELVAVRSLVYEALELKRFVIL